MKKLLLPEKGRNRSAIVSILLGCALLMLFIRWAVHAQPGGGNPSFVRVEGTNTCYTNSITTNCSPGSVALVNTSATTNFCLGSSVALSAANLITTGTLVVTITYTNAAGADCPPTITTNDPLSIITNWWVLAGFDGVPSSGTGLSTPPFTPTNTGVGTVTFSVQYSNAAPCDTSLVRVDLPETFYVVRITNQCFSPYPTNRGRLMLGVGEAVDVGITPVPPGGVTWILSGGGSLSSTTEPAIVFTAPPLKGDSTLTCSLTGGSCSVAFNTVEPDGTYTDYKVTESTNNSIIPAGMEGAAMNCDVIFNPTDVSFYKVQVLEVGEDGSNLQGFFLTYYTPAKLHHTPGDWAYLSSTNSWNDDEMLINYGNKLTWFPGEFDWKPIPVLWTVDETTVHPLTTWDQIMTIDSTDGTASITKFDSPPQKTTRTP